jgi:Tol biopolymer transport system component
MFLIYFVRRCDALYTSLARIMNCCGSIPLTSNPIVWPILFALVVPLSVPTCAWAQRKPRGANIFTMKADGSDVQLFVRVPDMVWHGSPAWSHDGRRIAFDASPDQNGGASARIYVASVKDPLGTVADLGPGNSPSWSPEDDKLVFYLRPGNPSELQPGVWTMAANGADRTWLCEGQKPRWSPDGTRIAFISDHDGVASLDVITPRWQKRVLQVDYEAIAGLGWSPDGEKLAFVGTRKNLEPRELGIVGAKGDENAVVMRYQADFGWLPSWSPDGKRLVVSMRGEETFQKLTLLSVAGKQSPSFIDGQGGTFFNLDATWSPDGQRLAFNSNREIPE